MCISMEKPPASIYSNNASQWLEKVMGLRFVTANFVGLVVVVLLVHLRPPCIESFNEVIGDIALLTFGFVAFWHLSKRSQSKVRKLPLSRAAAPAKVTKGGASADSAHRRPEALVKPAPARRERQTTSFLMGGWEAEVAELLHRIVPTPACEDVLGKLVGPARECFRAIVPEVKVTCCSDVRLIGNTDVGSLEADVVVSVNPETLARRLEAYNLRKVQQDGRASTPPKSVVNSSPKELAKTALRILTRALTHGDDAFYRYHHCSYGVDEPKVVLRVPASRGVTDRDVFVSVSVNCPTPANVAALMASCRCHDNRSAELALLVRRWARDRGISYAAKGHLSPYAWTCLSVFFLQRRGDAKVGVALVLPPLSSSGHTLQCQLDNATVGVEKESVATMFCAFLRFYGCGFDWKAGAMSVASGRQEARRGNSEVLISIDDPLDNARDLGASLSEAGFARLLEEFRRANRLLDIQGTGLKELLDPWVLDTVVR